MSPPSPKQKEKEKTSSHHSCTRQEWMCNQGVCALPSAFKQRRIERKLKIRDTRSHWSNTNNLISPQTSFEMCNKNPPHSSVAEKSPQEAKESLSGEESIRDTKTRGREVSISQWCQYELFGTGNSGTRSVWPLTRSAAACNDYWHVQYSFCHRDPLRAASSKLLAISSQPEKARAAD